MKEEHIQIGGTYRVVRTRFFQPDGLTGSFVKVHGATTGGGLFLVGESMFPLNAEELIPIVLEENV